MKIEIRRVTDWQRVVDAARFTQGKEPLGHEPSDEFKKQMILSEHSPLRELEFDIKMYGIPYWVSNHFVRHVHAHVRIPGIPPLLPSAHLPEIPDAP